MAVTKRSPKSKPKSTPRDAVLQVLPDGIIVSDEKGRIVDINPAAGNMTGLSEKDALGKPIQKVIPPGWDWERILRAGGKPTVVLSPSHPERTLEISAHPLPSARGKNAGSAILLRDISDRIRMEQDHKRSIEQMQAQTTEIQSLSTSLREQTLRDPLTNLYNRCYLTETLNRELARAARSKIPVSIMMIHLDQFEKADATYGDKAGIEILKIMSSLVNRYIRKGDIASRYAGEDFVVVMPGALPSIAGPRAEQLRKAFHDSILTFLGSTIECTFSCGVASYPLQGETPEAVMEAARKALQESVAAGGNRVTVSGS